MDKLKHFFGFFLAVCLIVGVFPVTARAASNEDFNSAVTENESEITFTVSGLDGQWGSWAKEETLKHNGVTVLSASGMIDTLVVTPSKPCYLVFDYIFVGNVVPSSTFFGFFASNDAYYYGGSNILFTAPESTEEEVDSDNWKAGVINCTESNGTNAIFSSWNNNGAKAYISNIRVYENLPDDYKAHVTVNYASSHGTLSGSISKNGQETQQVNLSEIQSGESFDLPLYSVLWEGNFTPATGASFDGFKITTPSGQAEQVKKYHATDISNKQLFYFTEPGNYTIDVLSSKAADEAQLKVSHSADGSEWTEETTPYKASYGDLYVEKYDSNQTWKLEFTKGNKQYDKITVKDNGQDVDLTTEDYGSSYQLTPGNDIHRIDIVYEQKDCTNAEKHLVIWPTLDFDMAFGEKEGMTDDFWSLGRDETLAHRNGVDAEKSTSGTYNFLYDPTTNSGAGIDEKHPYVFSSRLKPNNSMDVTSNIFTFSHDGLFSFDYMVYNGDNEGNKYDDSGYTFAVRKNSSNNVVTKSSGMSGWTHVETEVSSSDTVTIQFVDSSHVGTWLGISNINFLSEKVTLTVTKDGQGTVTGNGNGEGAVEHYKGQTVTLEATPSVGSAFVGWYDSDGRLITTDSVLPYVLNDNVTIKAKFAIVGSNVAQIGEEFYTTLDAAFEAAKEMDGNTVVRFLGTERRIEADFTVPAGETLLLPCSIGDTGYSPVTGFNPDGTTTGKRVGVEGKKYFNLTIPSGVTLTVEGTVLVNAVTGRPAAGHLDMDVNGGWAEITLDGNIVVKSGGVLDVCGYVRGSASGTGAITAEPGGEVRDLYVVRNWRGGSQAFHIFPYIYPMNEVDMHNIEVKTVINAGASFVGTVKMYASGSYYYTRFPQVDQKNGLIQQESGTVTRTYDTGTKRETWVLDGTGKISSSILNIVGMDLSTGTFLYPIDGDMDFVVKGNWNVVERLKFMPGVTVKFEEGTLTLEEETIREPRGNEIVFYPNFQPTDPANTDNTQYPSSRGHAQLTIYGGTITNVNCAFGGEIVVDKAATAENAAVIKFMAGKAVSVTSQEANGYRQTPFARELTFTATLGGYPVESGKTYTCYYEGDTLIIELAGESTTQEETYDKTAKSWSAADSGTVEYKIGDEWKTGAPVNAGTYPVRQVEKTESNYKLVKSLGTLTVKPLPVIITWTDPVSLAYDGQEKTVTATVENKKDDDQVTVTVDKATGKEVGEYTSTVQGLEGNDKDNYTLDGGENLTHTWNISIAQRNEQPTLSASTPQNLKEKVTITVTGIDGVTVEYSTSESGEYTALEGGTLEADQDTDYYFRYKADKNYTAGPAAHIKTGKFDAAPEDTPVISYDFMTGTLTGFGEGTYTVNGDNVAVTEGKVDIKDGWFGKTVSIVKKGNELTTVDSDAQSLQIPTRPEAPTGLTPNRTTGSGNSDGSITGLDENVIYEYRAKNGEWGEWEDVKESTSIEGLAAGDYEVRVKAKADAFAGASVTVTVTDYVAPFVPANPDRTETTTNPDGSTTTTTTQADGTKTETTTQTDGTVTERTTEKNGTSVETTTTPEGVVGTTGKDASGNVTNAEVTVPQGGSEGVVKAPVEVPSAESTKDAPQINVHVQGEKSVKMEVPVTDFGPGTVAVVVHPDGTEEVVRDCVVGEDGVILNVEGDVTLKIVENSAEFNDIERVESWAGDAIEFTSARELFSGTGNNNFQPDGKMSRGALVTLLYRLSYEPDAPALKFGDVDESSIYADAVAWADSNSIVNGYGNGTFMPDNVITREQLVTLIYQYAQFKGVVKPNTGNINTFTDADKVSNYAKEAMAWAIGAGIVSGQGNNTLNPTGSTTRAQTAVILMKLCDYMAK